MRKLVFIYLAGLVISYVAFCLFGSYLNKNTTVSVLTVPFIVNYLAFVVILGLPF